MRYLLLTLALIAGVSQGLTPRIINGDPVTTSDYHNAWSHTAFLGVISGSDSYYFTCGAAYLGSPDSSNDHLFLTAAHCLPEGDASLLVGVNSETRGNADLFAVAQAIAHPLYDAPTFKFDLAVLVVKNAASSNLGNSLSSLQLTPAVLPAGDPASLSPYRIAGWGGDQQR